MTNKTRKIAPHIQALLDEDATQDDTPKLYEKLAREFVRRVEEEIDPDNEESGDCIDNAINRLCEMIGVDRLDLELALADPNTAIPVLEKVLHIAMYVSGNDSWLRDSSGYEGTPFTLEEVGLQSIIVEGIESSDNVIDYIQAATARRGKWYLRN